MGGRMTAEDEEFNRIEMESRIKQEYVRSIKREENNRMIGSHQDHVRRLMEELAIARVCIRELGDRLSKLEGERNFCPRCGKRLVDGSIHTCTPPMEKT
jgi:hypothetical protein